MTKHILVPTDGSECSLRAAAYAGDLARLMDAKVTVQLVEDERSIVASAWNATGDGAADEARSSIEQSALENELADTRTALGEVPAGSELLHRWGHAANEICQRHLSLRQSNSQPGIKLCQHFVHT